jgi:hypothetical protein
MDADVERFFEECRADPYFRERPTALDRLEDTFEKFYRAADDYPAWQDIWDRIREIVTQKKPLIERFKVLVPIVQEIIALTDEPGAR